VDTGLRRLWRRYKQDRDEKAREELIVHNLPLVRYILGRLPISLPTAVGSEDLASVGVIALMGAVDDFDPSRGTEFATFAVPRIRGAMLDELREHDIVPRAVRQKARAIENAYIELRQRGGIAPTVDDVATLLGVSPMGVERTMAAVGLNSFLSLEAVCRSPHGGHDHGLADAPDARTDNPLVELMARETNHILTRAIRELPDADRLVIILYYRRGLMFKEIAEVLGVTKSRVSQIHARALFRLRAHIAAVTGARGDHKSAS